MNDEEPPMMAENQTLNKVQILFKVPQEQIANIELEFDLSTTIG
jgi:hypothetical protein